MRQKKWNGVNLVDLYAPTSKNLEAIVHTFLAVLKARPDYNRGKIAKAGLWLGEWLSGKYAHEVIAISKIIQDILKKLMRLTN